MGKTLLALLSALFAQNSVADDATPLWSYTGDNAPSHWGSIAPEYALCNAGMNQSPIDIVDAAFDRLFILNFAYQSIPLQVAKRNHTLEVDYATPANDEDKFVEIGGKQIPLAALYDFDSQLLVSGEAYTLQKIQFHAPSEHTYEYKHYPLEIQLLHKNQDNQYAIVSVFFETGKASPLLEKIWPHIPKETGIAQRIEDVAIDATQFLPKNQGYYHYRGSLTTPPCSERVLWFVMKDPKQLSKAQLARFSKEFAANNRPIQPRNFRFLLESL